MSHDHELTGQEVAIIGMAGKFPGAADIDAYWKNLSEGKETITFLTDEELRAKGIDETLINDENYVKTNGGFLEGWDLFDAHFFGYTPKEAEIMDPQLRLFHECAWNALENAGYDSENYHGLIGVYAGAASHIYWTNQAFFSGSCCDIGVESTLYLTDKDYLCSRVSHKLNLKGPSIVAQSTCSTSLVTVHLACQSLLEGECDMALAGGVTIDAQEMNGYLSQDGGYLSTDGHLKAFDAGASGTIFGNGLGIVVLKLLEEALNDGDHIYAVIKGTALNNDGIEKANYIAPSIDGQRKVIRLAHEIAEIEPESISYIEAHGTGTIIGDPIELEALKQAFATDKKGFCAIGSVKTNIGHLNAAAGVAGLIKTALAIKNRAIPPSLHFTTPNPAIDFENSPFYVNTTLKKWTNNGYPLRAGISSFGIGGTNAHIILEEPPDVSPSSESRPYQLLTLSAKTPGALDKAAANLGNHLRENKEIHLSDMAYTLKLGRRALPHRTYLVCKDQDEAFERLLNTETEGVHKGFSDHVNRPVIFMFSGQGSQYVNMGLNLYETEITFRHDMDHCFDLLGPILDEPIKDILYPVHDIESAKKKIGHAFNTGPVKFIFEYCLAKLLIRWGVKPYAMIGHSLGEFTAACLSGVFSLKDAIELVALRNRLIASLASGRMISVPLSEKELAPFLDDTLSIAAVNTPDISIVSGKDEDILRLENRLNDEGYDCFRFNVDRAGHSAMMDPILKDFEKAVAKVKLNKPLIPYISNVSGHWITVNEATDPSYWARHLRKTVRFSDGLSELLKIDHAVFIQVGADRGPASFAEQQPGFSERHLALNLVRHSKQEVSDAWFLIDKIGQLWLNGIPVNWEAFYADEKRNRIPLPGYPFEGVSYRINTNTIPTNTNVMVSPQVHTPRDLSDLFFIPSWKRAPLEQSHGKEVFNETWLIFSDDLGLGRLVSEELKDKGIECITVTCGRDFRCISNTEYTLNPENKDGYDSLLSDLKKNNFRLNRVVHYWGLSAKDEKHDGTDSIDHVLNLGFYCLLFLAQSLGEYDIYDALHIDVITNNMQDVTGDDLLYPEKATVLGPVKLIDAEYEKITCKSIDIVWPDDITQKNETLIRQLLNELTKNNADKTVAYRGKYRWAQSFDPYPLEKTRGNPPELLKEKGVYLMIGGLGKVGLILSEHLAKSIHANLVLMQRTPFPQRSQWDSWLSDHTEDNDISQKINTLLKIESLGAGILIISADVSDTRQVQDAVDLAIKTFGRIDGILHCAMELNGLMIPRRTREDIEKGFSAKIRGTLVLDRALKDIKPDFYMFCSSLSSVIPIIGQIEYCAANAFLDAFAHHKTAFSHTRAISINWNLWEDKPLAGPTGELLQVHLNSLKTADGIDAFDRILACGEPQVLISTEDIMTMIPQLHQFGLVHLEEMSKMATHSSRMPSHVRTNTSYTEPSNPTETILADIWQRFFGYDQVGTDDSFFDLGGDSVKALRIVSRIREELGFKVPIAKFFRHPTIRKLAAFIDLGDAHQYRIMHELHAPQGEQALSLVCVPYAAGGTSTYLRLADEISKLSPDIGVYAVEIPGNEIGCGQMEKTDVEEMAKECVKQIKQDITSPIALYGHCVGSFIALEICRLLEREHMDVRFVGIGGIVVTLTDDRLDPNMLLNYGEEEMNQVFMELGAFKDQQGKIEAEEFNFIANNLKEDVRIIVEHMNKLMGKEDENRIKAPIYNIVSNTDLTTRDYRSLYKNWCKFSDHVDLIEINGGGHYFIDEKVKETSGIIVDLIHNQL